jgi:hypothetical protein
VEQYIKKLGEQALVATMHNDAYDAKRRPQIKKWFHQIQD